MHTGYVCLCIQIMCVDVYLCLCVRICMPMCVGGGSGGDTTHSQSVPQFLQLEAHHEGAVSSVHISREGQLPLTLTLTLTARDHILVNFFFTLSFFSCGPLLDS